MSKRFRIGFSQEQYGYYYFNAESVEEAKALIEQLEEGEIEAEELPSFYQKTNGGQHEWINPLEEVVN
jgi:hypothetical protein